MIQSDSVVVCGVLVLVLVVVMVGEAGLVCNYLFPCSGRPVSGKGGARDTETGEQSRAGLDCSSSVTTTSVSTLPLRPRISG